MDKITLDPRALAMLKIMVKVGLRIEVARMVLRAINFDPRLIQYFGSPLVLFKLRPLPEWLWIAVYQDRLEQIWSEQESGELSEQATLTEVFAYLYPASLDGPLSEDYTAVYVWCARQVYAKHESSQVDQNQPEGPHSAEREFAGTLSDHQRLSILEPLQKWLRRRVMTIDDQSTNPLEPIIDDDFTTS
jgi:hypothetical protein